MSNIKTFFIRLAALMILLLVLPAIQVGALANDIEIVSDPETLNSYQTILTDNENSTKNAGEIWADKTVFANREHNDNFTIKVDDHTFSSTDLIMEVFSALGVKHEVSGITAPPIDLMIILDMSKSMGIADASGECRIKVAVNSVNEMAESLLEQNPKNRIGLALFSQEGKVFLPLDHYDLSDKSFIDLDIDEEGKESFADDGGTLYSISSSLDPKPKFSNNEEDEAKGMTVISGSDTNLKSGLDAGLGALRRSPDYSQNRPHALLITDGESNNTFDSSWEGKEEGTEILGGAIDDDDAKYLILKTLLGAAYQRSLVESDYGLELDFNAIAIGIDPEAASVDWAIKQATLNPKVYFHPDTDNQIIKEAYDLYTQWLSGQPIALNVGDSDESRTLSSLSTAQESLKEIQLEQIEENVSYLDGFYDIEASKIEETLKSYYERFSVESYTLIDQDQPNSLGYTGGITYEDPIGEYMQVGTVQSLLLFGKEYPVVETSSDANRRVFQVQKGNNESDQLVNSNFSSAPQSLDQIQISVEKNQNGQESLRVVVPEALLPVFNSEIVLEYEGDNKTIKSFTNTADSEYSKPLRLIYTIVPSPEISDSEGLKTDTVSETYKSSHTDEAGVSFYSNYFQDNSDGEAKVSFVPSEGNPFYYNQFPEIVYITKERNAKDIIRNIDQIRETGTYYFDHEYYRLDKSGNGEIVHETVSRSGKELLGNVVLENDGDAEQAVTRVGAELLGDKSRYDVDKTDNTSSTADNSYTQEQERKGEYAIILGNNAKMAAVSDKNPTLKIEKSHTVGKMEPTKEVLTVSATDIITYFLTISNTGNADSNNFIVKDEIPEGLELLGDSISDRGFVVDRTIYWEINKLKANQSMTVSFSVTISPKTSAKVFKNTAFIADITETFTIPSNTVVENLEDAAYEIVKKQALADMVPTTEHLNVSAGDLLTYTITVKNTGQIPIYNLNVVDTVPEELILHEDSLSPGAVISGRTITWTISVLEVGKSLDFSFTVTIPHDDDEWVNVAHAISEPLDIPSNEVTISSNTPRVSLYKKQAVNSANATDEILSAEDGDILTYYFILRNEGSAGATGVEVSDRVPSGLVVIPGSISHSGVLDSERVKWMFDTLEPGTEKVLSFSARVPVNKQVDHYSNTAQVIHDAIDSPLDSNTVEVEQPSPIDVAIEKLQSVYDWVPTDKELTISREDVITYHLLVTNRGTTNLEHYQVSDTVDSELAILKSSLDSDASVVGNTIVWTLSNLNAGMTRVLRFQVQVPINSQKTHWENTANLILPEAVIPSNTVRVDRVEDAPAENPKEIVEDPPSSTPTQIVSSEPESTTPVQSSTYQTRNTEKVTENNVTRDESKINEVSKLSEIPKTGIKPVLLIWILLCCCGLIVLLSTHMFTIIKSYRQRK